MEEVRRDSHFVREILDKKRDPLYLFSNENLDGVAEPIDYFDEDVLTVASGGDQYLSCLYHGAQTADIFDHDALTKRLTYLKIAAFTVLDYETFFIFFSIHMKGRCNPHFLSLTILEKLKSILDPTTYEFWRFSIANYREKIRDIFFDEPIDAVMQCQAYYRSKKSYYRLQRILQNHALPEFYCSDYSELPFCSEMNGKSYGRIYLSNIIEKTVNDYRHIMWSSFLDLVKEIALDEAFCLLEPMLHKGGIICVGYERYAKESKFPKERVVSLQETSAFISNLTFFDGWMNAGRDAAITYQKR